MIQYRTFRNPDPPLLAEVWNASLAGPRTVSVPPRTNALLEHFLLSKPYFDPKGMFFALDNGRPVGFAHAGFASAPGGATLDTSAGVICALGVIPSHRRQGVGGELLRLAEGYLRQAGARLLIAGASSPHNPFTFGLYGGADSSGFLDSHTLARPFFEKHGYQVVETRNVLQRSLRLAAMPPDARFHAIRNRYDIVFCPAHRESWWRECVLGPFETVEFRVQDKQTEEVVARTTLWEMDLFRYTWQETCIGLLDLYVEPAYRRRGLAKYLMAQLLVHLHRQAMSLFEVHINVDNQAALGLFAGLEFEQVDTGRSLRKA